MKDKYVVLDDNFDPIVRYYNTHKEAVEEALSLQQEELGSTYYVAKILEQTVVTAGLRSVESADVENV